MASFKGDKRGAEEQTSISLFCVVSVSGCLKLVWRWEGYVIKNLERENVGARKGDGNR